MKSTNHLTPSIFKSLSLAATFTLLGVAAANAADYPTTVLADHPSVYYRFEEISGGTAFDSSSNLWNASYIYNSTNTDPQLGLPGILTNSILFNGGGFASDVGLVDIPASTLITPMQGDNIHGAAFSCELWVRPTAQPATFSVPIEQAQFPNGWNIYVSGADFNGGTSLFVLNMPNGVLFQSFLDFPISFPSPWYHLVLTFDGVNALFYINGVSHSCGAPAYSPAQSSDAHVGTGPGVNWTAFIGGVDEVAFYTNVLSSGQVQTHYQVGTNSFRIGNLPPTISQDPLSTTNYSGLPVTFTVALSSGDQPLHYKWLENGTPIGTDANSVTFNCQYPADNLASIKVIVTNNFGSATSAVATLTVLTNVTIVGPPFSIVRNVGSFAAFRVAAVGAVPISYQWSNSVNGGATFNAMPGETRDTLWLTNVQLAMSANQYAVHVSNTFTFTNPPPATLLVQSRAVNVPLSGYGSIIAADKPVAYWRLDEPTSSPTAVDAVGSFDGSYDTSFGPITWGVITGIPHMAGVDSAIALADTNSGAGGGGVVRIPYALELNPYGKWSFEAWVRPDSQDGQFRTILSSMYNFGFSTSLYGWLIYQHNASAFTLVTYNGGGGPATFASDFGHIPLTLGSWYYLALTDDGTTIQLYVNGVAGSANGPASAAGFAPNGINGDPSLAGVSDPGSPEVLAQRSDGGQFGFNGGVDDAAFYNYPLTPEQIHLHYIDATKISIVKIGTNVVVTWPVGTLQAAGVATGTYTNVTGATSPYTNSAGLAQKYYRVVVP